MDAEKNLFTVKRKTIPVSVKLQRLTASREYQGRRSFEGDIIFGTLLCDAGRDKLL
jgi:hypothetical protein